MRLENKVAIITGGGGGIARHCARGFGKEGAKLVLADINLAAADETVDILKKEGIEALSIKVDVTSLESVEAMVKKTVEHFGRVDILVNNAAVLAKYTVSRAHFYEIDLNDWDKVMTVNLKGTFLCSRVVFPYMKAQGRGKIINFASTTFMWGAPNFAHYVASKGAIVGLSRAMAREIGEFNINVNCIAPGSTFSEGPEDQAALEFRKKAIPRRSIPRVEYPEDVVGATMFLASSESDFITGQVIVVDGGHIMQ